MDSNVLYMIAACGLAGLGFAWLRSAWVNRQDPGNETMVRIAGHIRDGAMAFLGREYRVLAIFVLLTAGLLAWANSGNPQSSALVGLSLVVGALCSGLAGFFGMRIATAASSHDRRRLPFIWLQLGRHPMEQPLQRMHAGQVQHHPANRHPHPGPDLDQLGADRGHLCPS